MPEVDAFTLGPLTPGELIPMVGYTTLDRALKAAKDLNLSSFTISKAVGFDGVDSYSGWEEVYRHPIDAVDPTNEQYEDWQCYPCQDCWYTRKS